MASLRRRVIFGGVLWTVGLLVVASAAFSVIVEMHPSARVPLVNHVHGGLQQPLLLAIATLAMVAGVVQIRRGLAPLDRLRDRLSDVRHGRAPHITGTYPSEVQPLVEDLNAMIDHQTLAVERAVAKAGDLAHGLKTPLAVLAHEATRVGAAGESELATSVTQQVDKMRRQINWHLAHARAAASGATINVRTSVHQCADGLGRTLQRLRADRPVAIDVRVGSSLFVRVQREDLDEMLGNLMDNACKWARTEVIVGAIGHTGSIVVTVDDDGPGVPAEMRERVLGRGVRADERERGSGLGLAIVRDLVEIYGGSITLGASSLGGLRAELTLPNAGDEPLPGTSPAL